ncbi:hypothetical protein [Methylorubrum sp. SB2]
MNIRCQMETLGAEGPPPPPSPAFDATSGLPPIPKVAVIRL